jgi:acyl carrier protein
MKNSYFNYAWSKWDNMGMSQGESLNDRLIAQNAGYFIIDVKKGFASFEGLIKRDIRKAMVGIDYINSSLSSYRSMVASDTPLNQRVVQVYYRSNQEIEISDESAEIIYLNVSEKQDRKNQNELSPMEIRMKTLWETVLNRQDISIKDGFFQVGGTSIKVVKLLDCIYNEFGVEISIIDLFTHPSIRELVDYMSPKEAPEDDYTMILI